MIVRLIAVVFAACFTGAPSATRASEANVINEPCRDTAAVSMFAPITTYAALSARFAEWSQFTQADVDSLPDSLFVNGSDSTFDSGVLNVAFTINGKSGRAYAWARNYGKTADGPTYQSQFGSNGKAILIFPGTPTAQTGAPGGGSNPTVEMMAGYGYQAVLFTIGTALGDAFVYSPIGQDLQSLFCGNGKKMILPTIEAAIANRGSSAAILAQIQGAAIMKWLKLARSFNPAWPSYSKTAVMGLSKGAWLAAMTALYTPPDAVVVSSGFSLKEFRSFGFSLMGGNLNPQGGWTESSLTAAVKASPAKWLFTTSSVTPEIAFMLEEAADGETASALASANVSSLTTTKGHLYPMPETKTFLQNALQ